MRLLDANPGNWSVPGVAALFLNRIAVLMSSNGTWTASMKGLLGVDDVRAPLNFAGHMRRNYPFLQGRSEA